MTDEPDNARPEDVRAHRTWLAAAGVLVVAVAVSAVVLVARTNDDRGPGSGSPRPLPLASSEQIGDATGMSPSSFELTTEYSLEGDLPELGGSGPVYQLRALDIGPADVQRAAAAIGVTGEPQVDASAGRWTVSDGQQYFSVEQSGPGTTFSYSRMETPSQAMTPPTELPSEAEAERIARDLVAGMGADDGTTDWTVEVRSSGSRVAMACAVDSPCPTTPPVDYERTVRLSRVIDGNAIEALGFSVNVGDHGEIRGVSGTAAMIEPVADYPLMTTRAAYDALVAGTAVQTGFTPTGQTFSTVGSAIASSEVGPGAEYAPPTSVAPETVNVTVTGVERGEAVVGAVEDGEIAAYLVPTYRFAGHSQYGELRIEVVAVDPSMIAAVDPASIPVPSQMYPPSSVGSAVVSDTTLLYGPPEPTPTGG